ncbi:MAG: hypothetical protein ABSC47_02535 [Terracidiphilus sp.]|jgi:hypothetical protein
MVAYSQAENPELGTRSLVVDWDVGQPPVNFLKGENMRRFVITCAAGLAVALAIALVACGPSKPTGAEYLGKWEAMSIGTDACQIDISRNGESFIMTLDQSMGSVCDKYEGIFTLTPEGNLKGGPMGQMILSYDKGKNRVALSYNGVRYLKKL